MAEVEKFLLGHGEQIVDVLGSEVDRIESRIKVRRMNGWLYICAVLIYLHWASVFVCRKPRQK